MTREFALSRNLLIGARAFRLSDNNHSQDPITPIQSIDDILGNSCRIKRREVSIHRALYVMPCRSRQCQEKIANIILMPPDIQIIFQTEICGKSAATVCWTGGGSSIKTVAHRPSISQAHYTASVHSKYCKSKANFTTYGGVSCKIPPLSSLFTD